MRFLKTNTATRVTIGPFLDKTDGITPEVALTATNEHLTLVVDDGGVPTLVLDTNATASGGNNDMVHITNDDAGLYDLELTAANVNYVGRAILSINYVTDHLPVFHEFMILSAQAYDAMFGTGNFSADAKAINGVATTSVTAVNANIGQTQPVNFTGTGGSALVKTDVTDIATAAVSTTTAQLGVNVVQISTDATAADNAESFFDGTGYAGTNNVIPTVTTLTNAPTISALGANTITATSIAADAITAAKIADAAIDFATFAADCKTGTGLKANVESITADAITAAAIANNSIDNASFAADVGSTAFATNIIAQAVFKALDSAIGDGVTLTADGLLDKIRTMGWIVRNKIEVTDADGSTKIYKDNSTTAAFTVANMLTDNVTTTTRLRAE